MRLTNQSLFVKLKRKNKGNVKLTKAIDELIGCLEENSPTTDEELKEIRSDADKVHSDGFYFFDINVHRTMIMIEFDENEGTIIWVGTHDEYETTFKNNKSTIEKWLRARGHIA